MSTIVFRNVDRTHSVIVFFSSIFLLQTRIMEHLFRVTMRFWNSRDLINGWHCDTLIHHKSTCPARTKKHLQWSNMSKIQQKSKNYIPVIHNVYPSVCVCVPLCVLCMDVSFNCNVKDMIFWPLRHLPWKHIKLSHRETLSAARGQPSNLRWRQIIWMIGRPNCGKRTNIFFILRINIEVNGLP